MKFKLLDKTALVKSILYRFFASCVTFVISFAFTGSIQTSSLISICEFVGKIFCFYVFEVGWKNIMELANLKHYRENCFKLNKASEGKCIWLTGLNSVGKTSIGKELVKCIDKAVLLDGDAIRSTINKDLGFSPADISTNVTKIAQLAKILIDQGYVVIVACISKNYSDRQLARSIVNIEGSKFYECYVHVDKDEWHRRLDLLHKHTPTIQQDYEISKDKYIDIDTTNKTAKQAAKEILCKLMA